MNDEEIKNDKPLKGDIDANENYIDLDNSDTEDVTFVESTEDGEALQTKDVAKKLREEIKTLRKEKEEYLTGWQRAKADYINLQKEFDLARINISILTKEKMTEKLLPALDSFEMAFANKEHWETLDKDWRLGIESIYQQLLNGLKNSGIETISEEGIAFDPNVHQSINVIETDDKGKDHNIAKVLQVGYKIGDRVIRPAKVTIFEYKET